MTCIYEYISMCIFILLSWPSWSTNAVFSIIEALLYFWVFQGTCAPYSLFRQAFVPKSHLLSRSFLSYRACRSNLAQKWKLSEAILLYPVWLTKHEPLTGFVFFLRSTPHSIWRRHNLEQASMKPDEFISGDPEVFQDSQSTRPSAGCRAEGWVTFQNASYKWTILFGDKWHRCWISATLKVSLICFLITDHIGMSAPWI